MTSDAQVFVDSHEHGSVRAMAELILNAEIKTYLSRIDSELVDKKSREKIILMTSKSMIALEKRYLKG